MVIGIVLNKGDFHMNLDWSSLLKPPLHELVCHTY